MATPSDNDRDDALLRRLYDEPDADGADGELAREVDSFKQLRSAVAEYARATEVEPPSRGVDELLAAARQRAPARPAAVVPVAAGGGGLWARLRAWLAPIAAHPALASAAMVVVVAVVGGVLYVKGRGGVTEGAVGGETATPAETRSQGSAAMDLHYKNDPGVVAGLEDQTLANPTPPQTPTPTVQPMTPPPEDPAVLKTPPAQGAKPPVAHANGTAHKPSKSTATSPGAASASAGGDGEGRTIEENYGGEASVAVGQGAVRTDGAEDDHAAPVLEPQTPPPSQAPTSSPPPPPPTAGAVNGRDTADEVLIAGEDPGADAGKTKSAEPPKRPAGPDVEQLTRQARTAAKSGDCGVVRAIAGKVKKANAVYYKQTFAVDATIKKCL